MQYWISVSYYDVHYHSQLEYNLVAKQIDIAKNVNVFFKTMVLIKFEPMLSFKEGLEIVKFTEIVDHPIQKFPSKIA